MTLVTGGWGRASTPKWSRPWWAQVTPPCRFRNFNSSTCWMCEWEGPLNEVHWPQSGCETMWNLGGMMAFPVLCRCDSLELQFTSNCMITDNFNYKGFILIINHLIRPFLLYMMLLYWIACTVLNITFIFNLSAKLKTTPAICKSWGPFSMKLSVLQHCGSHGGLNKVDSDCSIIKCTITIEKNLQSKILNSECIHPDCLWSCPIWVSNESTIST